VSAFFEEYGRLHRKKETAERQPEGAVERNEQYAAETPARSSQGCGLGGMEPRCTRCNKRLSRKTARLIDGKILCSACVFPPLKKGLPS
jgi:formylmethanofuran dehydrogenase subunit E